MQLVPRREAIGWCAQFLVSAHLTFCRTTCRGWPSSSSECWSLNHTAEWEGCLAPSEWDSLPHWIPLLSEPRERILLSQSKPAWVSPPHMALCGVAGIRHQSWHVDLPELRPAQVGPANLTWALICLASNSTRMNLSLTAGDSESQTTQSSCPILPQLCPNVPSSHHRPPHSEEATFHKANRSPSHYSLARAQPRGFYDFGAPSYLVRSLIMLEKKNHLFRRPKTTTDGWPQLSPTMGWVLWHILFQKKRKEGCLFQPPPPPRQRANKVSQIV